MRRNWGEMLPLKPPFFKKCKTFESVPLWIMAELTYDFNMNRFKNRLETFKDWPFTEETGSCCTAMKVRRSLQKTNLYISKLINYFVCTVLRWLKQASSTARMILLMLHVALFVSKNSKDGSLRTIHCT